MKMELATEFKPVTYTLSCDECGEDIVLNIQLYELLDEDLHYFDRGNPHRRKPEGKQGGLWRSSQSAVLNHLRYHSIPEPQDVRKDLDGSVLYRDSRGVWHNA